jgi:hypothetical protein
MDIPQMESLNFEDCDDCRSLLQIISDLKQQLAEKDSKNDELRKQFSQSKEIISKLKEQNLYLKQKIKHLTNSLGANKNSLQVQAMLGAGRPLDGQNQICYIVE